MRGNIEVNLTNQHAEIELESRWKVAGTEQQDVNRNLENFFLIAKENASDGWKTT